MTLSCTATCRSFVKPHFVGDDKQEASGWMFPLLSWTSGNNKQRPLFWTQRGNAAQAVQAGGGRPGRRGLQLRCSQHAVNKKRRRQRSLCCDSWLWEDPRVATRVFLRQFVCFPPLPSNLLHSLHTAPITAGSLESILRKNKNIDSAGGNLLAARRRSLWK